MPAAFARWPLGADNPTGNLALDGNLYVVLNGAAAAFFLDAAPKIVVTLSRQGGAGQGVALNDLLHALGRTCSLSPALGEQLLVRYILGPAKCGQMLDLLMSAAGRSQQGTKPRAPTQLRSWLAQLRDEAVAEGRAAHPHFIFDKVDAVLVSDFVPPVIARLPTPAPPTPAPARPRLESRPASQGLDVGEGRATAAPFVEPIERPVRSRSSTCAPTSTSHI